MKKLTFILLSFSFLIVSVSCKRESAKSKNVYSSKYKQTIVDCRKELGLYLFTSDVPGMSVAVMVDNQLVWSEGLGLANVELNVPATTETKFRVGGASKLFTGALLAKMIEDGKIELNKNVKEYYPELPEDKNQITIHQLASHMSGIRPPTYEENKNGGYLTMKKGLEVFIKDSLLFSPGQYSYESDYNYDLLGVVMEEVAGDRINKLLSKNLTDTLHLDATMMDDPVANIPNRSECFERNMIARSMRSFTLDNRHRLASIGLLSSAFDLATLMNEYLFPKYLKKETVDHILEPLTFSDGAKGQFGLGPIIAMDNMGQPLWISNGTTNGGSASVIVYPNQKLVVAMACNLSNEQEGLPVFKIAEAFLKLLAPDIYNKKTEEIQDEKNAQPDNEI